MFRCRWWWYLGSHVLHRILSLQLDMTRCPMTVRFRCALLSLLDKCRGSTVFSRHVVGTSLRWVQTSEWVNGNKCSSSRSRGRSAIGGWIGLAFLCLHLINLDLIVLNAFRNPTIQNSCWRMFLTYSVPSCRLSRCAFSNRICTVSLLKWMFKIGCSAM